MAGFFMCLAFHLGLLGFDLGSQSWLPWLPSLPSLPSLPLIPSELLLGFHLGSLCFRLGVPTRRQRQGLFQHL